MKGILILSLSLCLGSPAQAQSDEVGTPTLNEVQIERDPSAALKRKKTPANSREFYQPSPKQPRSSSPETEFGPVSSFRVFGATAGTVFGLGLGHPFQGRWLERGWMFTFSQVAGLGLMISGGFMGDCARREDGTHESCRQESQVGAGTAIFLVSRVWEIFDLWTNLRPKNTQLALMPRADGGTELQLVWLF